MSMSSRKKSARKKPARRTPPVKRANGESASAVATRLAAELDRGLKDGKSDLLAPEALQALMAALCRSYAAQVEAGGTFMPLGARSRVTATDIMVTASKLLKAGNLQVFELGMWQSWTGR